MGLTIQPPPPLTPVPGDPNLQSGSGMPMPVQGLMGGAPMTGLPPVNPILDEIDQARASLSPPAKKAIEDAHGLLGLKPSDSGDAAEQSAPPMAMPSMPSASPGLPPVSPLGPALSLGGQPGQTQAQHELQRLQTTGSGVSQIHNPWARVPLQILDAIGRGLAPGIEMGIPGTSGHHDVLLAQQGRAVKGEEEERAANTADSTAQEKLAESQASAPGALEHTAAETKELGARGEHESAEAEALTNPKADKQAGTVHEDKDGNMWVVHPDGTATAVSPQGGEQLKGKTTEEKTGTVHEDNEGNMWIVKGDGTATPVTAKGTQLKGKATEDKPGSPEQQFIDEYRAQHKGSSVADAERAFKAIEPPQRPPQALMIPPGGGAAQLVQPGTIVQPGSVTPGGASGESVSADKETKAAEKAKDDASKEYQLVQGLAAKPSPTNDLAIVMRFIGATKPDSLGKLRLNNNEVNLVYGTRSAMGNLEALVSRLQNGQSLTPQQRTDMLSTMKILASGGGGGAGGTVYHEGSKQYSIPAGQEKEFEKDHPSAKRQ